LVLLNFMPRLVMTLKDLKAWTVWAVRA
jgi:hypothetical protein